VPRQLNIRSDEAFGIARELAERYGATTTRIVEEALREYRQKRLVPSRKLTREQSEENFRVLMAAAGETARCKLPGATSDHRDLYDETGLPR